MFDIRRTDRNRLNVKSLVTIAFISASAIVFVSAHPTQTAWASDPTPVNPPGEIPVIVVDEAGNAYEVFTPQRGRDDRRRWIFF